MLPLDKTATTVWFAEDGPCAVVAAVRFADRDAAAALVGTWGDVEGFSVFIPLLSVVGVVASMGDSVLVEMLAGMGTVCCVLLGTPVETVLVVDLAPDDPLVTE